ncbi:unnamed protein product [Vicia faba]|uniref:Amino acid transporter transmembrane domain-containing protein n=1 Tax=Vicia faba TaxID=3906 RepID=A0AAV0Z262_VICFA|nr:unnamed protein product [Vicia faba]
MEREGDKWKQCDKDETLNIPLVREHEEIQISGSGSNNNIVTTSFLKTCFNGLNALSGLRTFHRSEVSFIRSCLNGLNAIAGVGILSVPYALASGGWLSLALLFSIAAVAFYTGLLMERCMEKKSNIRTFPDIGFLILAGDNLSNILPIEEFQVVGLSIGAKQFFVILVALIILPTGDIVNWNGIPTAVSLYAFCYCAHPVFPTLYNSMKNKHQFSNVLIVCFILTTASYASMAIIGYLMFGSNVESQVTLNLPLNKLSSKIAIYTTLVNPIAKFALMATPITNALKELVGRTYKNNRVTNIFVSTLLVVSNVIVALSIPYFGSLMSLVGAFLSATACILLPCLCYLKISGNYRKLGFETVTIVMIVLVAIVMGVSGTYISIVEIIQNLK